MTTDEALEKAIQLALYNLYTGKKRLDTVLSDVFLAGLEKGKSNDVR